MTRLLLLLGVLILATSAEAQNKPFSVVILSDPQLFRFHNPHNKKDELLCEDKENPTKEAACGDIGTSCRSPISGSFIRTDLKPGGDDFLCGPLAAADAVTDTISRLGINAGLGGWKDRMLCAPQGTGSTDNGCISQGHNDPIRTPSAIIMNGDLTENSTPIERIVFKKLYGDLSPLYPGLGNHDIGDKAGDGAHESAQWMAHRLDTLQQKPGNVPHLVSRDLSGVIKVKNRSGSRIKVSLSGKEDILWTAKEAEYRLQRALEAKVTVKFERRTTEYSAAKKRWVEKWVKIESKSVDPSTIKCFKVSRTEVTRDTTCDVTKERRGSLSYSFDHGNYRFIQLHNFLGFEKTLSADKNPFEILDADGEGWLTRQLVQATKQGKAIVLNVHDHEHGLRRLVEGHNFNVVVVFAGHKHSKLGELEGSKYPNVFPWTSGLGTASERKVPVILSGAAFAGEMLYVDFHDTFMNWAAVRAWTTATNLNNSPNHKEIKEIKGQEEFFYAQDVPDLEKRNGLVYGKSDPVFVKDKRWIHNHNTGDGGVMKQGTILVDFSGGGGTSNQDPIARCSDVSVGAGAGGTADASINNGSSDPEGLPLVLKQLPSGPYGAGDTFVTLIVEDQAGALDTCSATVTVTSEAVDTDGDDSYDDIEDAGPNGGDCNDDGSFDRMQASVTSLPGADGSYMCLTTNCTQRLVTALDEGAFPLDWVPSGLPVQVQSPLAFELECSAATATVYYFGRTDLTGAEYRKYGPTPSNPVDHWYSLPAIFGQTTIAGETVATATFTLVDGGLGDSDLSVDGRIIDPGGPAMIGGGPTEIGVSTIPTVSGWALLLMAAALGGGAIWVLRLRS